MVAQVEAGVTTPGAALDWMAVLLNDDTKARSGMMMVGGNTAISNDGGGRSPDWNQGQ